MSSFQNSCAIFCDDLLASRLTPSFVSGTDHQEVAKAIDPDLSLDKLGDRALNYYDQEHRRGSDRYNRRGGVGREQAGLSGASSVSDRFQVSMSDQCQVPDHLRSPCHSPSSHSPYTVPVVAMSCRSCGVSFRMHSLDSNTPISESGPMLVA